MKYSIEDLRNGKVAVINDGTLQELREVFSLAFPTDNSYVFGGSKVYSKGSGGNYWYANNDMGLPTQSVKDFLIKDEDNDPFDIYKNIYINRNSEISRRDYFAAMALHGIIREKNDRGLIKIMAMNAVVYADALIAELDKPRK